MVGRHVLDHLSKRNVFQMVTSRNQPTILPDKVVWNKWDLCSWQDDEFFNSVFHDVEAVFHIGAIVPNAHIAGIENEIMDANVRACLNLGLWALKKDIPIVFLSGAVVYANPLKQKITETDEKTKGGFGGFYGFSKLLAEEVFNFLASQGLRVCVLRPSSIYGFGLPTQKMISKFLQIAVAGGDIELVPPIYDKINLIHAHDVAEAMWQAFQSQAWGTYNIGEKSYSVYEIAQECVKVSGNGRIRIIGNNDDCKTTERYDLDCRNAQKKFAFSAKVSLTEGIKRMRYACTSSLVEI